MLNYQRVEIPKLCVKGILDDHYRSSLHIPTGPVSPEQRSQRSQGPWPGEQLLPRPCRPPFQHPSWACWPGSATAWNLMVRNPLQIFHPLVVILDHKSDVQVLPNHVALWKRWDFPHFLMRFVGGDYSTGFPGSAILGKQWYPQLLFWWLLILPTAPWSRTPMATHSFIKMGPSTPNYSWSFQDLSDHRHAQTGMWCLKVYGSGQIGLNYWIWCFVSTCSTQMGDETIQKKVSHHIVLYLLISSYSYKMGWFTLFTLFIEGDGISC